MKNLVRRKDSPSQSALRRAAFGLLGATTRDKKQRILELEEDQSLSLDPGQCSKARQDLTSPRSRLAAELEWLPGLSPKRAFDYRDLIDHDLSAYFRLAEAENGLVRANLVAAGLEVLSEASSVSDWTEQILALAHATEEVDPAALMVVLNEDRAVAECPQIQSAETVRIELDARERTLRDVMRASLDRLVTAEMLKVVFNVVDVATNSGANRSPALIEELMDAYGLDTRGFLEKEAENVTKLVEAAKAVSQQTAELRSFIDKLEKVVVNWTHVAKPIQMSMKARGLVHDLSSQVGYTIRGLSLELVREADDIASAQRLTNILQEHFSQFPEMSELLENDVSQLNDMALKKSFIEILAPIRNLCKKATADSDDDPSHADRHCQRIISSAPELIKSAQLNGVTSEVILGVKDEIAYAICSCAIDYGNSTSKWQACVNMLEAADTFANGTDALERVHKNLDIVRKNVRLYGNLTPIDSAPSLYTINGCGVTLYGNTDLDPESESYMATYYFVLLMIPIFPICRYRVTSTGGSSYRFLGKGPLRDIDKWHIAISVGIFLFLFFK